MSNLNRQAIILAGGTGSRLWPTTLVTNKHLLPVYDRPMIYFPIATLISSSIRDILIITNPQDVNSFEKLLGDGSQWGVQIRYEVQAKALGIGHGLSIGEKFIKEKNFVLILGDNLFFTPSISTFIQEAFSKPEAAVFAIPVKDPERFGIVTIDKNGRALEIHEKPQRPKSNLAITGCYLLTKEAFSYAKVQEPSYRGEFEITDILDFYRQKQNLKVSVLKSNQDWNDAGTSESLFDCSQQSKQNLLPQIGCPEIAALQSGFLPAIDLEAQAKKLSKSDYGQRILSYLRRSQLKKAA